MAKITSKQIFTSKYWHEPRKYSKAEALLYLANNKGSTSIRHLAMAWQWSRSSVERFIKELKREKMWDTFWDTFWDTKRVENNNVTQNAGTQCGTQCGTPFGTHLIVNNNNPPKILSISKDISNIYSPLTGEECSPFERFQKYILDNAPRVAKMKEPFTEAQFLALKDEYDTTFICELLQEMHNYQHLLTKNISANLTFRNWAKRRQKWDNEKTKQRATNTQGHQPSDDELARAVAEGLSRANTQQEWQG